jgi:MFS family permease
MGNLPSSHRQADGPSLPIQRLSRVRLGVLAFACTLSLVTYLDRICISRAAKEIQEDLGFNPTQMGLVFSAFLFGYLLFEVPGGWMGDRWGSRRVLTRIVLWWSVFTTLTGCVWPAAGGGSVLGLGRWGVPLLLNGLWLMIVIRFLFGAGEAGAYPNLTRVVGTWFPFRERAFAQGAVWMSARLGGAFAPLIIGRLSALLGWRLAFAVLGAIGFAWALAFRFWFRDRPSEHPACTIAERDLIEGRVRSTERTAEQAEPATSSTAITAFPPADGIQIGNREPGASATGARKDAFPSQPPAAESPIAPAAEVEAHRTPRSALGAGEHAWPPLGELISSLTMWGLGLAAAAVSFAWYFLPTWQPKYLMDVYGISYENSEIIIGLPFLCGAAGSLLGGRLSDVLVSRTGSRRWGRSLLGVGGFTAAGLCVMASGFVAAPWQAMGLWCLASLFNDLAIPVIWAVCADVGGRFSGTVAGIMNMLGGVGGMLSPALIPVVLAALPSHYSDAFRWRLIFAGLSVAWFVGAAAWLLIDAGKPLFKDGVDSRQ